MAQLGYQFDATQVDPTTTFDPVPPGEYVVQVINSEMKTTKDNAGQYLSLEMDIIDGAYQGRKVFDRLNLQNNNAKTVEIAQRTLSAICHATGVLNLSDSEQLHFKPVVAKVVVKPASGQYSASNEIKGYTAVNGQGATVVPLQQGQQQNRQGPQQQPANQQQAQPKAAAAGGGTPPWRRK